MTSKQAFIDLDGTVCNSEKRFEQARKSGQIDWKIAFHPPLLEMDELIVGSEVALEHLEAEGWTVIFLSSRPESLRKATKSWLKRYSLLHGPSLVERQLILKAPKFRFSRTPHWKAEVICAAGAKAAQVLFVDDETENLSTVKDLWRTKGLNRANLRTCKSLQLVRDQLS
jgi:hypothetical protein